MKLKSRIAIFTVNTLLCVAIVLLTVFFMNGWGTVIKVLFYGMAALGLLVELISFILKKHAIFKSAFVLVVCAAVVVASIVALSELGNLNAYPTDEEKIQALVEIIKSFGGWGMFIYFLIQLLQVVVLPLPAAICYIPGSLIWGPLTATLIATAGVVVGSVIAYFIGRVFGKRAVIWIAGKETCEKYSAYLSKRGKVLFVIMQILPFFPDDILCMVVGVAGMNFWFFLTTIILVRPFIIAAYCYLGSGTIIPFSGWGIAVWIAIFAVCIVLAILSFKYQDKFENWLVNKFSGKKKKQTEQTDNSEDKTDLQEEPAKEVENKKDKEREEEPQEESPQEQTEHDKLTEEKTEGGNEDN